jgi:DNA-binding XRE family transcriptional regulator
MHALPAPIELGNVDNAEAGRRIRERRTRLRMTVKDLASRAGVDRGRLAKLEVGDPAVRATTIGAVEAALDEVEQLTSDLPAPLAPQDDSGMVEFRVSGNFGVDVVVKGPVQNLDALEASVSRLVARMQREAEDRPASSQTP